MMKVSFIEDWQWTCEKTVVYLRLLKVLSGIRKGLLHHVSLGISTTWCTSSQRYPSVSLNFPDVVRREHRLLSWNRPCDVAHTSNDTKHLQESCKGVLAFQTFPDRLGLQGWLAEKIYAWTVHAFFFQLWFYWDPGFVKRVCIKNYLALYKCSKAMWFTSMSL